MAQVSNVQSHTLRILGSLPDSVKESLSKQTDVVVLESRSKENADRVKTFITADNISSVIELLSSNNLNFRPHFYSVFVKFNQELKTTDTGVLNDKITSISPKATISYSRVDENGHTGKVVVDRFEDYNALRSYSGDFTFYKFNRNKAQNRTTRTGDGTEIQQRPRTQRYEGTDGSQRPRTQRTDGTTQRPRTQRTDGDTQRPEGTQNVGVDSEGFQTVGTQNREQRQSTRGRSTRGRPRNTGATTSA